MNSGEVQIIMLLQLWHETIYILMMENFFAWKPLRLLKTLLRLLENLKASEEPFRPLENL